MPLRALEALLVSLAAPSEKQDVAAVCEGIKKEADGLISFRELLAALRTAAAARRAEAEPERPAAAEAESSEGWPSTGSLESPVAAPEPAARSSVELGSWRSEESVESVPEEAAAESFDQPPLSPAEARRRDALQRLAATQAEALAALRADRAALEGALGSAQRHFCQEHAARRAAEAAADAAAAELSAERERLAAARRAHEALLAGTEGAAELAEALSQARARSAAMRAELASQRAAAAEAAAALPGCEARARAACARAREAQDCELRGRLEAQRRAAARAEAQLAVARAAAERERGRRHAAGCALEAAAAAAAGAVDRRRAELEAVSGELVGLCERLYSTSLALAAAGGDAPPAPRPRSLPWPLGAAPAAEAAKEGGGSARDGGRFSGLDEEGGEAEEGELHWPSHAGSAPGRERGRRGSPAAARQPRKAASVSSKARWASSSANGTVVRRRGRLPSPGP